MPQMMRMSAPTGPPAGIPSRDPHPAWRQHSRCCCHPEALIVCETARFDLACTCSEATLLRFRQPLGRSDGMSARDSTSSSRSRDRLCQAQQGCLCHGQSVLAADATFHTMTSARGQRMAGKVEAARQL